MKAAPPSSRTALWLSAVACPGIGQFLQRRPIAGAFYLLAFLVCLFMLGLSGLLPWFRMLSAALDAAEGKAWLAQPAPDFRALLVPVLRWAGLAMIVYFANVVDAGLAHRRLMRAWNLARAGMPPELGTKEGRRADS